MAAASFEALLSAYTAHEGGGQAMVVALQSAYEEIGIINITDYKTYAVTSTGDPQGSTCAAGQRLSG